MREYLNTEISTLTWRDLAGGVPDPAFRQRRVAQMRREVVVDGLPAVDLIDGTCGTQIYALIYTY